MKKRSLLKAFCMFFFICNFVPAAALASAEEEQDPAKYAGKKKKIDFTTYSLEELIDIEITSVLKTPQPISKAAAAVFVITEEDIRRSGMTTLPDLFRMVPGMHVARSDPGDYAVSTRGFLGEFANKLLVLVDGRTIYSPLYSGTIWDMRDMVLEHIQRIEIIRGPGASLWGANAVNGVINIITKNARDTQGLMFSSAVGNEGEGYAVVRYGGVLNDQVHYRLHAKRTQFGNVDNQLHDEPEYNLAGFRIDGDFYDGASFSLIGNVIDGYEKSRTKRPMLTPLPEMYLVKAHGNHSGANILAQYERSIDEQNTIRFQVYFDTVFSEATRYVYDERADGNSDLRDNVWRQDTYDVEFQHNIRNINGHNVVWGCNYRIAKTKKRDVNIFYVLDPDDRYTYLYRAYLQDDVALLPGLLSVTAGVSCEYNSFTDLEIQPNVRILCTPAEGHTVWTALSRAVRTPSRGEADSLLRSGIIPRGRRYPGSRPVLTVVQGSDKFVSEELIAAEIGYRYNRHNTYSADVSLFYNLYDRLNTFEAGTPQRNDGYLQVPYVRDNKMKGHTYGIECVANLQINDRWRVQGTYTYLKMNLHARKDSKALNPTRDEDLSPRHQCTFRSMLDITDSLELDASVYYVDEIKALGIKEYTDLVVRLGYTPSENVDVSIIGHNLLDNKHNEFSDEIFARAENEVRRSFFIRLTWHY